MSLMVIGAVVAVVAGASTFAPFTDEETISGGVTAGVLKLDLDDVGTSASDTTITFDPTATCGAMVPGSGCSVLIEICNGETSSGTCTASGSNLEFTYAGDIQETGDPDSCFVATLTETASTDTVIAAGASDATITDAIAGDGTAGDFDHDGVAGQDGANADSLDPGERDQFTLTVTLDDDNACQGDTVSYAVHVLATQSASPHD
jgi:predicted ribosomally synthesized peptide with SipW-like signal peptide